MEPVQDDQTDGGRPPSQHEEELQALFDATAPASDPVQLQRLARFAASLPDQPAPWYQRWRIPLMATAVGAAALAVVMGVRMSNSFTASPLAGSAAASASGRAVAALTDDWQPADDEEAWALLADGEGLAGGGTLSVEDFPEHRAGVGLAAFDVLSVTEGDEQQLQLLDEALTLLLEDG